MTATVTSAGSRLPSAAAPIAAGCCAVAAAAYVAVDDPSDGGAYLPCPFRILTGLWCPGCGLTRATHHLLRGDVLQAIRFNLFVVVVLGALTAVWMAWMLGSIGRPTNWARRFPVRAQAVAGAVLMAFAVVRNLPGVDGLTG